jgi:hypothetical protein
MGVIEDNVRRGKLFSDREQQLFQVVKGLWNSHNNKTGSKKFSENCKLKVTYRTPQFPTDPKTQMETIIMEQNILHTGDKVAYQKLYPHLGDKEITKLIKEVRQNRMEQAVEDAKVEVAKAEILIEAGIMESSTVVSTQTAASTKSSIKSDMTLGDMVSKAEDMEVTKPKIDNKAKQAEDSGKQGSDPRKKDKTSKPKKK